MWGFAMHFNVYIDDKMGSDLKQVLKKRGGTRNAVIREAIEEWIIHHAKSEWPLEVSSFTGISDSPPFEQYRKELKPPKETPWR